MNKNTIVPYIKLHIKLVICCLPRMLRFFAQYSFEKYYFMDLKEKDNWISRIMSVTFVAMGMFTMHTILHSCVVFLLFLLLLCSQYSLVQYKSQPWISKFKRVMNSSKTFDIIGLSDCVYYAMKVHKSVEFHWLIFVWFSQSILSTNMPSHIILLL